MNKAQIEKQYIFVELELEDYCERFYARDLSDRQVADLNKPEYIDVHQSFKLGSPLVAHITSDISIEIFIQTNHFEASAVVKAGIVVKHAHSTVDALFMEAIIWTSVGHVFLREDGGFPLKYEALPLLRQSGTEYGFVLMDDDFLTKADELYRKMTNKEINLYSKLLQLNALDRKGK